MFFHQYYATDDIGSHFPRRLSNGNNFLHSTWGMNRARQLSAMGQRRLGPPPQSSLAHRGELAGAMDPGSGDKPLRCQPPPPAPTSSARDYQYFLHQ